MRNNLVQNILMHLFVLNYATSNASGLLYTYMTSLKLGKEQKQITYLLTFLLVRRGESLLCAFVHQCEK
jgi:hypothetical protein